MRFIFLPCFLAATTLFFGCSTPSASSSSSPSATATLANTLQIDGDAPAKSLTIEDLESLSPIDVEWTHKGDTRTYRAVSLENVLRNAGIDPGSMAPGVSTSEKRAGWKYAVVATATDGYQATFSVPEVFHDMGRTGAFVAFAENHGPIPAAAGPLRLIVTTDGEGSRSVRNLARLTIIDLRRVVRSRPVTH